MSKLREFYISRISTSDCLYDLIYWVKRCKWAFKYAEVKQLIASQRYQIEERTTALQIENNGE